VSTIPTTPRHLLAVLLLALAITYALRFQHDAHRTAGWVLFCLPPLLLLPGSWRGRRLPTFWAGTLALLWFSHGVMEAWSAPAVRGHALVVVALSLGIVFAAAWPALVARRRRRTLP
jgi:uncharacterized membrane protein